LANDGPAKGMAASDLIPLKSDSTMSLLRASLLSLIVLAAGCMPHAAQESRNGLIVIDGSSTLYPIAEAIAEEFQRTRQHVRVSVGISGTGGGFNKFCRGEIAINGASRPISASEVAACADAGITFYELLIAFDALTIVVNPKNHWLTEISVDELRALWQPSAQGHLQRWSQLNPDWPDAPVQLFGAGAASGTFDYFAEAVVGRPRALRGDFAASEDDNQLVSGIASNPHALGFLGYAYYNAHQDRLRAVPVRSSPTTAAVAPSARAALDGSYRPLARPLLLYVNAAELARNQQLRELLHFALHASTALIEDVGYIALPTHAQQLAQDRIDGGRTGSMFNGHAEVGLNLDALLARTAR